MDSHDLDYSPSCLRAMFIVFTGTILFIIITGLIRVGALCDSRQHDFHATF